MNLLKKDLAATLGLQSMERKLRGNSSLKVWDHPSDRYGIVLGEPPSHKAQGRRSWARHVGSARFPRVEESILTSSQLAPLVIYSTSGGREPENLPAAGELDEDGCGQ